MVAGEEILTLLFVQHNAEVLMNQYDHNSWLTKILVKLEKQTRGHSLSNNKHSNLDHYYHDPGQSKAEVSNLEWYYYRKAPPHHHQMFLYNIELFHTYCNNPGQSKIELYNLEWQGIFQQYLGTSSDGLQHCSISIFYITVWGRIIQTELLTKEKKQCYSW